jgi:antitoxin HicB
MNNQYFGSDFDDFLAEEGLLAEAEATAIKRVIAFQIQQAMQQSGISKTEMAEKMQTSDSCLDTLLDPDNLSVNLDIIAKAASTLGKKLKVELV